MKQRSPPLKRCFICDLFTESFVANSTESVRLIATVLDMHHETEMTMHHPGENDSLDYQSLILDDGTCTINVLAPECLISKSGTRPGCTVECLTGLGQQGEIRKWYAKALWPVTDPHAELLRWMELSCSSTSSLNDGCLRVKRNTSGLLQLISSQASVEGASCEDLALVLQVPANELQNLIEDLQLKGQVYQNQAGNYVPL
jgi:hypothetical protein